jgi:hypothetical protein
VSDITAVLRQRVLMCGICFYHINKTFHLSVTRFFSTVLSEQLTVIEILNSDGKM